MINNKILTEEMKKYEEMTRKKAIWLGDITEGFKKCKKGEKIYYPDKRLISMFVSEDKKLNSMNS